MRDSEKGPVEGGTEYSVQDLPHWIFRRLVHHSELS